MCVQLHPSSSANDRQPLFGISLEWRVCESGVHAWHSLPCLHATFTHPRQSAPALPAERCQVDFSARHATCATTGPLWVGGVGTLPTEIPTGNDFVFMVKVPKERRAQRKSQCTFERTRTCPHALHTAANRLAVISALVQSLPAHFCAWQSRPCVWCCAAATGAPCSALRQRYGPLPPEGWSACALHGRATAHQAQHSCEGTERIYCSIAPQ